MSNKVSLKLLQEEKDGKVDESWREESWQEFVVLRRFKSPNPAGEMSAY